MGDHTRAGCEHNRKAVLCEEKVAMPLGAGKYDQICTEIREKTNARGIIVIIIDGNLGNGFSCQADPELILKLPDMLEFMAKEIRGHPKNS